MKLSPILVNFVLVAWFAGGIACSPVTPKAYIVPVPPDEKIVDDNTEAYDPKVDILFVVDNSGSMDQHQENLAKNVAKFTSTFTKTSILDYNIGIVTTEMPRTSTPNPSRACCGLLVGDPRIVNKNTFAADQVLARNFRVGTNGSSFEASFDPVMAALSSPLVSNWNGGFLRPEASLVVIFITDAEDQSLMTDAVGLYKFLLDLKKNDPSKVLAYGVIVPSYDTLGCERDEPDVFPVRIERFLSMVSNKNNIMNICDPDYGTRLANMAKDIVEKVGNIIYLSRPADGKSIRVTYGNMDLPMDYHKGWSFDPQKNAILLGDKIDWSSQAIGSRVKVFYTAAKFEETPPR
ncbi:MAG: vWA domain-containing protein [Pseudobdellovibrionaceae bacterium]